MDRCPNMPHGGRLPMRADTNPPNFCIGPAQAIFVPGPIKLFIHISGHICLIAFGKSTSQRICPKQHTPKIR